MKRLRVGVVGVGHLGQHHARIFAGLPDVELVAVVDSRLEQAQTIADKFGTRAVADYRSVARPGRRRLRRRSHSLPSRGRRHVSLASNPHARRETTGQHAGRGGIARLAEPFHRCLASGGTYRALQPRTLGAEPDGHSPQVHHGRTALNIHVSLNRHRGCSAT